MRPDILTYSGNYFDFMEPEKSVISIEDIAHGLSNTCRFGGHSRQFYSVAQHSVLVAQLVPPKYSFQGLMHDAAEAYIGDIPKPLKNLLPDYREIEKRVELAIFKHFGLPLTLSPTVKNADLLMLATEQRDLMAPHDDEWMLIKGVEPIQSRVIPITPDQAFNLFMQAFDAMNKL